MDCYVWATERGVGCNVHLVDNWFRTMQVEVHLIIHLPIFMRQSRHHNIFELKDSVIK